MFPPNVLLYRMSCLLRQFCLLVFYLLSAVFCFLLSVNGLYLSLVVRTVVFIPFMPPHLLLLPLHPPSLTRQHPTPPRTARCTPSPAPHPACCCRNQPCASKVGGPGRSGTSRDPSRSQCGAAGGTGTAAEPGSGLYQTYRCSGNT